MKTYKLINAISDVTQDLYALKLEAMRDTSLVVRASLNAAIERLEYIIVGLPLSDDLDQIDRQILALRLEAEALELTRMTGLSDNAKVTQGSYNARITVRTLVENLKDFI